MRLLLALLPGSLCLIAAGKRAGKRAAPDPDLAARPTTAPPGAGQPVVNALEAGVKAKTDAFAPDAVAHLCRTCWRLMTVRAGALKPQPYSHEVISAATWAMPFWRFPLDAPPRATVDVTRMPGEARVLATVYLALAFTQRGLAGSAQSPACASSWA